VDPDNRELNEIAVGDEGPDLLQHVQGLLMVKANPPPVPGPLAPKHKLA